jgi:amino acid transporter
MIDSSNGGTTAVIDVFLNREDVNLSWMAYIILLCSILAMSASVFCNLLGQTRLMVQYARDGLLFSVFEEIDEEKRVPVKGALI